jgi:hypothetical protein
MNSAARAGNVAEVLSMCSALANSPYSPMALADPGPSLVPSPVQVPCGGSRPARPTPFRSGTTSMARSRWVWSVVLGILFATLSSFLVGRTALTSTC